MTDTLRRTLIDTARTMSRAGLAPNRSGNVSVRGGGGFLITPSGLDYDSLSPDDAVEMTLAGKVLAGEVLAHQRAPSSEWRFHAAIYAAKPGVHAVVHTHSTYATALACTGRAIPAFHYMVTAAGGGDIPLADYATFGTDALSRNVTAVLSNRQACLIAHHGAVACGPDAASALRLAIEVEDLARKYAIALSIGGVRELPPEEVEAVLRRFETYGQSG